jgi:16S rRNA (guanine527-N7)-methyltransferase
MELTTQEVRAALEPFGVEVGEQLAEQIGIYVQTLLFWNQKVNLTAVTDQQEILTRHFGESMFGAQFLARTDGALADVGSGAGFPGLALKLVCPALRVLLIEPVIKKAVFLAEVVRALELKGVEVAKERTERIGGLRVDMVTARAVGDLSGLLGWAAGALGSGGQAMLWLGATDADAARSVKGWDWSEPVRIPLSKQRVILSGLRVDR